MAKRTLTFEGIDAPPLPISRVVEVDVPKRMLYVEEMPGAGTFRLTYSAALLNGASELPRVVISQKEPESG